MKRNKSNERQRSKQADNIRRIEVAQMAERLPDERAKEWSGRHQIESKDVLDYLADKYDIKTGVSPVKNDNY